MAPYLKMRDSDAIDDGWTITDGDGNVIAHLDTETMADGMMAFLLGATPRPAPDYEENVWYPTDSEDPDGDEAEEDEE